MTTAANPLIGEAALVVGAGTYVLVLDVNAFCVVEQALDMPLSDLIDRVEMNAASITEVRALLWAGLSKNHPCTLAEAGDIMSRAGIGATRSALTDGLIAAFGVAKEGDKPADPPNRGKAGTG